MVVSKYFLLTMFRSARLMRPAPAVSGPTGLRRDWRFYVCALVAVLFSVALTLPAASFVKALIAFPGVAALVSVLYKLWREDVAHERAVQLQELKDASAYATASYMAKVAYDKHVLFCEEYMAVINDFLPRLWQEGPTFNCLRFASDLSAVRSRYAVWLTGDIEIGLFPVEAKLRRIGAGSHALEGLSAGSQKSRIIEEVYDAFGVVVDALPLAECDDEARAAGVAAVTEHIRSLLGIQNLTELRFRSAELALKRMGEMLG